jgi:EAL domain-containing protein (putative c-di-GMP-specific phosphodiesterase class I)
VETEAQRRFLIETGADLAQGFLFGRPMDIAALTRAYGPAVVEARVGLPA